MNKGKIAVFATVAAVIAVAAIWTRGGETPPSAVANAGQAAAVSVAVPASFSDEAKIGERAFNAICAARLCSSWADCPTKKNGKHWKLPSAPP